MLDSTEQFRLLITNTLGMSALSETLKCASLIIHSSNRTYGAMLKRCYNATPKEVEQTYAFVQGTGLDILIYSYHLNYDPEVLRDTFNSYMERISH